MSDRTEVGRRPEAGALDETQVVTVDETRAVPVEETQAVPVEETQVLPAEGRRDLEVDETRRVPIGDGVPAGDDRPSMAEDGTTAEEEPSPSTSPESSTPPAGDADVRGERVVELRVPGHLPLPLRATAALLGEYRWIEHALYALLGRWVEDAPLASVKVHLDAQSLRHAWHAELWADRLPQMAGSDPERLTLPSRPTAALFRELGAAVPRGTVDSDGDGDGDAGSVGGLSGLPGALPRLAGLYRVVIPRLVASYERHLAVAVEPTDGPVIRALRLVLNDELEDWRAGEHLVQRLVTRPHDVDAVVEYQRRLESALVGAGARSGLVRIPENGPPA